MAILSATPSLERALAAVNPVETIQTGVENSPLAAQRINLSQPKYTDRIAAGATKFNDFGVVLALGWVPVGGGVNMVKKSLHVVGRGWSAEGPRMIYCNIL